MAMGRQGLRCGLLESCMDLRMPGVGGLTAMEQRASVDLPAPAAGRVAPGERVIVGVRPEYVTVSTTGDGPITGTVSIIEHLGTSSLVTVRADGTLIGATVPEHAEPPPGTTVSLTPN